uniref:Uncharacterized protein n=1 Tax=Arion vulgaris TaxID=1028688 RepID=A0A0B7APS9_9EUPU
MDERLTCTIVWFKVRKCCTVHRSHSLLIPSMSTGKDKGKAAGEGSRCSG